MRICALCREVRLLGGGRMLSSCAGFVAGKVTARARAKSGIWWAIWIFLSRCMIAGRETLACRKEGPCADVL